MMLHKFGQRLWIARMMITLGVISCGIGLYRRRHVVLHYAIPAWRGRSGFCAGILLYLAYWFPARERAGATALFMTATVLLIVFGAPLSGWLIFST